MKMKRMMKKRSYLKGFKKKVGGKSFLRLEEKSWW
jgi:hypothetical protein